MSPCGSRTKPERAHSIGVGPFDSPHRIDALDECLYTSLWVEGGEAALPVSHESVEMAGPDFCIVARSGSIGVAGNQRANARRKIEGRESAARIPHVAAVGIVRVLIISRDNAGRINARHIGGEAARRIEGSDRALGVAHKAMVSAVRIGVVSGDGAGRGDGRLRTGWSGDRRPNRDCRQREAPDSPVRASEGIHRMFTLPQCYAWERMIAACITVNYANIDRWPVPAPSRRPLFLTCPANTS